MERKWKRELIIQGTSGSAGRGRLFEGGDYFKYFLQREAINRGTAIIRKHTVVLFYTGGHVNPENMAVH